MYFRLFVWLHCVFPLCTFVYLLTLCIHTQIPEDDFKVKTTSKTKMTTRCKYFLKKVFYSFPQPHLSARAFLYPFLLKHDIYEILIFFNSLLFWGGYQIKRGRWDLVCYARKNYIYFLYILPSLKSFLKFSTFSFFKCLQ